MSLRDKANSHKIVIPLVANLTINRAYDPSSGGIGGPGLGRTSIPESWINTPGVDPACNRDPDTDAKLVLWLDTAVESSLILGPEERNEDDKLMQRRVLEWQDQSGYGRHAVAVSPEFAPKLSKKQPFFTRSVDMAPICVEPVQPEDPGGGGGAGDPPPENCTETTMIRSCGVNTIADCNSWDWEIMQNAQGDWRTEAGKIVVLASAGEFQHSVATAGTEDFTFIGGWCPAASRPLPGYDQIDAWNGGYTGTMYNADPGKDGSVQLVLAGMTYPYTSGASQDFLLWFKDFGAPVNNSPSMAGRHVKVTFNDGSPDSGVIGTGTVNSTGQVEWCRCCIEPWQYYTPGSADVPAESMFTIEIAAPGADPFPWTTQDCADCGGACGTGGPRAGGMIQP